MNGTVYKRGSVWAVSYYTGNKVNGIYERKSKSGFATKRDAQKYLRERITEIESGVAVLGSRVLLKDYLSEWLEHYSNSTNMAKNTYRGYKVNIYKHIIPVIGNIKLDSIKPDDIDNLIKTMADNGLSVTSQRYVLATLRIALNTAVKRRILSFNVMTCIDFPKPKKYVPVVLSVYELKILFNKCVTDLNYLPILLSLSLGLRRGEVLGLKWSDFDFEKKTLHIQRTATPKNGGYDFSPCKTQDSNRIICLPEPVIDSLKSWQSEQSICYQTSKNFNPKNFVFFLPNGQIISASGLNKRFKALLKECNLPDIRFHDLRHSWATMMLSLNIPTKIASSILGHSNVTTTLNIYSHILTDMQKPAIDVLNSVFTVTK